MTALDLTPPEQRGEVRLERLEEGKRHWPLGRIFALGASLAALFAVTVVILGGVALWRLSDTRVALLDSAGPALIAAQQLSGSLLNQETGVRGYDLGRRPEFLQPYQDGRVGEEAMIAELRRLAAGGRLPGLDAQIDAVEQGAQNWRTQYAGAVAHRAARGVRPGAGTRSVRPGQDEGPGAARRRAGEAGCGQARHRERLDVPARRRGGDRGAAGLVPHRRGHRVAPGDHPADLGARQAGARGRVRGRHPVRPRRWPARDRRARRGRRGDAPAHPA